MAMLLHLDTLALANATQKGIPQYLIEEAALWLTERKPLCKGLYLITSAPDHAQRMASIGRSRIDIENLRGISLLVDKGGGILALINDRPAPASARQSNFALKMNSVLNNRVDH
ncbi:MAG: hypothetical protein ACREFK_04750 [Stellaceae bacterium]